MKTYRSKIYTVDVQVKEWFDKVNGNSYFGGIVTVNFGRKTAKQFPIPFQYGYGDSFRYKAVEVLQKNKVLKNEDNKSYWNIYNDLNIIARHNKQENCRKKDVLNYIN